MDIVITLLVIIIVMIGASQADDEKRARMITGANRQDNPPEPPFPKFNRNVLIVFLVVVAIVIAAMMTLRGCANNVNAEQTNEIVTICSTTESVETITVTVPETTEIIHIEETEAPSAPVSDETVLEVDQDELEMLACVIYQEAGGNGSCDDCRRYVADVVLNRIESLEFPDTMYEVLTAEGQYGEFYWTGIKWPERAKYDVEKDAVARAYRIAEEVLSGQHSKLYGEGYIWQARHVQGTDGFWCCGHWYGR